MPRFHSFLGKSFDHSMPRLCLQIYPQKKDPTIQSLGRVETQKNQMITKQHKQPNEGARLAREGERLDSPLYTEEDKEKDI